VTGQYVVSLVELAKQALAFTKGAVIQRRTRQKDTSPGSSNSTRNAAAAAKAIELLQRARNYPPNLGEGKLHGAQENQILFWLGIAHRTLGETTAATGLWQQAAVGLTVPSPAMYYNDQNPETIFYQGLALRSLNKLQQAKARFESLLRFGKEHLKDKVTIDYFAVSLPEFLVFDDDLDRRNQIHCRYLMSLGYLGLGQRVAAQKEFSKVLELDPSHLPARLHLNLLSPARLRTA
jgi:tetratricopeptide (TPR) repeat protein